MASPQLENGYTAIANELLEKINQSDFTLREIKILISVIRYTYGFRRKEAELSLRFLAESSNIDFRHVQTVVKSLISKNVLIIRKHSLGILSRTIQLNKDYDTWIFTACNDNSVTDLAIDQIGDSHLFGVSQLGDTKDTSLGQKSDSNDASVTISANGQLGDSHRFRVDRFGDSHRFRVDQLGDTKNPSIDQKGDASVTDSANARLGQIGDKEIKHINKTLNKTSSSVCLIPDELKNLKGFVDLWKDWTAYRNEINKPLTPIAIKVQLNKLVSFKSKGYDLLEIISTSISNSWLDFYEPRENKSPPGNSTKPEKEYITSKLRDITADEPGWL